jgi:hypothetical protein
MWRDRQGRLCSFWRSETKNSKETKRTPKNPKGGFSEFLFGRDVIKSFCGAAARPVSLACMPEEDSYKEVG